MEALKSKKKNKGKKFYSVPGRIQFIDFPRKKDGKIDWSKIEQYKIKW